MTYHKLNRIFFSAVGGSLIGIGAGIAISSGYGADALGILWEGMAGILPLTIGQSSLVVALVCVAVSFILRKEELGISTLVNPVLTSLFTDVFVQMLHPEGMAMKLLCLVSGIVLIGIGAGMASSCDTGKDSYNAVVFAISHRFGASVALTRSLLDLVCFLLGMLLGAGFKIGPILGILIIGWILQRTTVLCSHLKFLEKAEYL